MDFKKNIMIVNLQISSKPTIKHNSINDFIIFNESKFHVLMFSCLRVGMEEEKRKYGCCLIFGNQCIRGRFRLYFGGPIFVKNKILLEKKYFYETNMFFYY